MWSLATDSEFHPDLAWIDTVSAVRCSVIPVGASPSPRPVAFTTLCALRLQAIHAFELTHERLVSRTPRGGLLVETRRANVTIADM